MSFALQKRNEKSSRTKKTVSFYNGIYRLIRSLRSVQEVEKAEAKAEDDNDVEKLLLLRDGISIIMSYMKAYQFIL